MNRLTEIAEQTGRQKMPPVHLWSPEHSGEIDICVDAQGLWFHAGKPIVRDTLIRLFASILWFEGGQHYLVTPVEKWAIVVEDVPYMIHQMEYVDNAWVAVTNMYDRVIIGEANPVELRQFQGQWIPYIKVRYDLWARVNRHIFYQWVSAAMDVQPSASDVLVLNSNGYSFEVAK